MMNLSQQAIDDRIKSVGWYHTIDLGNGVLTPGLYDHRPYLKYYGLPDDMTGKTALDIGAASGFFSFEMERRGAQVTAVDLPEWFDHDFGPNYQADQSAESGNTYLHRPFEIAAEILGSSVRKQYLNIYDISPETVGMFDVTFCGSLLVHLTDPIKALWNIARVTKEKAIIATLITGENPDLPLARMIGHERGDGWWIPTRTCFELMVACAGFTAIEWVSEFRLDHRDGTPGPYHGVLHAYTAPIQPGPHPVPRDELIRCHQERLQHPAVNDKAIDVEQLQDEITRLQDLVRAYENGRFIRLMKWLHRHLSTFR